MSSDLPFCNPTHIMPLIGEMREDAIETIEKIPLKMQCDMELLNPWCYLHLMKLCDANQKLVEAYQWGCEVLDSPEECDYLELYEFHLGLCELVEKSNKDDRDEIAYYIERNKQHIRRIRGSVLAEHSQHV